MGVLQQRWERRQQEQPADAPPAEPRPLSVTERIFIARPAEDVWAFVQPAETSVFTDDRVVRAFTVPGTPVGDVGEIQCQVIRFQEGVILGVLSEVVELDPGRRAVTRSLSHANESGSVTTVEPLDGGCSLQIEFRDTHTGPGFEAARAQMSEAAHRYLFKVKSCVETGVRPPTITGSTAGPS